MTIKCNEIKGHSKKHLKYLSNNQKMKIPLSQVKAYVTVNEDDIDVYEKRYKCDLAHNYLCPEKQTPFYFQAIKKETLLWKIYSLFP